MNIRYINDILIPNSEFNIKIAVTEKHSKKFMHCVACILVASAYVCMCPQLTLSAPLSTAVDILLYLDIIYHLNVNVIYYNLNTRFRERLSS
jgi:hypothetical protein